jgi:hypothetical protein
MPNSQLPGKQTHSSTWVSKKFTFMLTPFQVVMSFLQLCFRSNSVSASCLIALLLLLPRRSNIRSAWSSRWHYVIRNVCAICGVDTRTRKENWQGARSHANKASTGSINGSTSISTATGIRSNPGEEDQYQLKLKKMFFISKVLWYTFMRTRWPFQIFQMFMFQFTPRSPQNRSNCRRHRCLLLGLRPSTTKGIRTISTGVMFCVYRRSHPILRIAIVGPCLPPTQNILSNTHRFAATIMCL